MSLYLNQNQSECPFTTKDSWVILSKIEQSIKRKIESVGTPLKYWKDIKIYRGVLTGCNEAFIISTEKRNEILNNCSSEEERTRTDEIIRPILRGRDIKRYGYCWDDKWLIATFPSRHYDIDLYPSLKSYLLKFGKEKLEQSGKQHLINGDLIKSRKKTNNQWFETQDSIAYWEDFYKPKIIYPNMTKFLPFLFDNNKFVTNQKCFIMVGKHIEYLCAFLNSSLFKFCYRDSFPELQGGTRELSKIFFEKIVIKKISDEQNDEFKKVTADIQENFTEKKAKLIDKMIFDLYGLNKDEQDLVGYIEIK